MRSNMDSVKKKKKMEGENHESVYYLLRLGTNV